MENKLNLVNWLMVVAVFVCIIAHRMFLKDVAEDVDTTTVASLLQMLIIGIFILFMMMVAGLAAFVWQKITADPNKLEKEVSRFPKVSFACGTVAFVLFSIYWMAFGR